MSVGLLPELRVIDAGSVPAIRSQSLWHGLASAMGSTDRPVLSFCRPTEAYVCVGFHRRLNELDLTACSEMELPVLRRQIGGGPVYCDTDQLFFQITIPADRAPASIDRLYQALLGPAAAALRRLGLDARLECINEIVVGDRKLSGTGAGRIGDAVTVVGNVIFRFPHARMARVIALPAGARTEFLQLLQRYVSSLEAEGLTDITVETATSLLVDAFAEAFELKPVADQPTRQEKSAINSWERRFRNEGWVRGPDPRATVARTVKVKAGVWLVMADDGSIAVTATVIDGRVERARVDAAGGRDLAEDLAAALLHAPFTRAGLHGRLAGHGSAGRRLAEVLTPTTTLN
jgi:lipoate-protein ligase A